MCQSRADGGRRCTGTPTGRALYSLYKERRTHPDRSEEITARIQTLREAESLYGGRFVTPFDMPLPNGVPETLDTIRGVGNPLVVGGAVRDVTVGASNKDVDIEVYGTDLDSLANTLRSSGYRVDEVGKAFGVLKVSKKGVVSDLDIAVPRRENAVGAGHRGFEVTTDTDMTVLEAAERRDFTINSMSYDPRLGVLVDPYEGAEDLKNRTLRAVSEKFAEDPLRVLRGVQFAGRFGMTMDPDTVKMCRNLRSQYETLAKERVAEEWMKLYTKGTNAHAALTVLRDTGWDDTLPGLKEAVRDPEVTTSMSRLGEVPSEYRASMGAALMSRRMRAEDRRAFVKRSTVGNDTARLAHALVDTDPVQNSTAYARKVRARQMEKTGWTWEKYRTYAEITGDIEGVRVADLAIAEGIGSAPEEQWVQGRDILARVDRKPGPWLGKLVADILDRQYRGEFGNREAAIDAAVVAAVGYAD